MFITGGSRGIGRAIALRFARDGADRITIGYLRNDEAAEATADELRAAGAETGLIRGNVFRDTNADGKFDSGDDLLSGWRVKIEELIGSHYVANGSVLTDANGHYSFARPAGTYKLTEVPMNGLHVTTPVSGVHRVIVTTASVHDGENFGNM